MAKRGRPKKNQGWSGGEAVSTRTEMTDQATASVQVIAPEPAPLDPIVLPEAAEALSLLSALAHQNDRVTLARKRYEESAATTKARKGTLEQESAELSRMLTEGTHVKPMPLFDAAQSEADLKAFEEALSNGGAVAAPEAPGETSGVEAGEGGTVLPFVAPAASETAEGETAPTADVF